MKTFKLSGENQKWRLQEWMPQLWEWVSMTSALQEPMDSKRSVDAKVPGSVYSALRDAGRIGDIHTGLNSLHSEWVADRDWMFYTEFDFSEAITESDRLELCLNGIDDEAVIWINGKNLGSCRGLYKLHTFDVTSLIRRNEPNRLEIILKYAPDQVSQVGRTSHVNHIKPRFSYKWDFSTRSIESGIRGEVYLRMNAGALLENVWVKSNLVWDDKKCMQADVQAVFNVDCLYSSDAILNLSIYEDTGLSIAFGDIQTNIHKWLNEMQVSFRIENPNLWWVNGHGEQHMYRLKVNLVSKSGSMIDEKEVWFGIREINFILTEGASDDAFPYQLVVNKIPVWIRGWNWVPISQHYTDHQDDRYERAVRLATNAHVNLLRIWGGGSIEIDHFYHLCDQLGILVWQEFPQSSSAIDNKPQDNAAYLYQFTEYVSETIRTIRNHPSLAIWCGGNELQGDDRTPLGLNDPNLKYLQKLVNLHDPERFYLPTSPSGPSMEMNPDKFGTGVHHDVHGPWLYAGNPSHYEYYNQVDAMLHSEFGMPGLSDRESILYAVPEAEQLWPEHIDSQVWTHHGGEWWNHYHEVLKPLFGELPDLSDSIYASQMMQAEALGYAIESHRRRKFINAGVLPWQFNEPFLNVTCTSAVDYLLRPKAVYYRVASIYKKRHVSMRFNKLDWAPGQIFSGDIYVHNGLEASNINWSWEIRDIYGKVHPGQSGNDLVEAYCAQQLGIISLEIGEWALPVFFVDIHVTFENEEMPVTRTYLFSASEAPIFSSLPHLELTTLNLVINSDAEGESEIVIHNNGNITALNVHLKETNCQNKCYFENNFIHIYPGESKSIRVFGLLKERGNSLVLEAWNSVPLLFTL